MKLCNSILFSFLLLPLTLFAGISGTYRVKGYDPQTQEEYTGMLVISKNGSVYSATWTYSDLTTDTGTGIIKDGVLSFVFQEGSTPSYGVLAYEIDGKKMSGRWARFGTTEKGKEKIKKVKHTPPPV